MKMTHGSERVNNPAVLAYDRELRALASGSAGRQLDEVDYTLWATKLTGHERPSCARRGTHLSCNHCFQPFLGRGTSSSGASFSGTPGFASGFTAQMPHVHDHYPSHVHAQLTETQQASPPQPPSHAESSTKAGAILLGAGGRTCAQPVELPIRSFTALSQSTWPGQATESVQLPTPLKVGRWPSQLASHPLPSFAAYLTLGLSKGFQIDYEDSRNILQRATYLVSATVHSAFISENLSACVAKGEISGPFANPPFPNFMSSGLGVVPKKNRKLRLIHHLFAPVEHSINDGIPKEDFSLHYVTVDDAIAIIMRLRRGCLLAKTDIRNAFCLCPVNTADYHLSGITWQGLYHYDRVLPFGLRSAPFIFNEVADASNGFAYITLASASSSTCWTTI